MDTELLAAIREELSPIKQDIARMSQDITRIDQKIAGIDQQMSGMDQKISGLDQKISGMDQDITQIKVMIENDIQKQLNLLAEGQRILLERLPKPGKAEELDDRVDVLETVVTHHSADIAKLKKAL